MTDGYFLPYTHNLSDLSGPTRNMKVPADLACIKAHRNTQAPLPRQGANHRGAHMLHNVPVIYLSKCYCLLTLRIQGFQT